MAQTSITRVPDTDAKAAPIFRWAGSKRKLLPTLAELAPKTFDRYIEPFAGSACFFFHLSPISAVLGDINQDLIVTYQQVRASPDDVYATLASIPDRSAQTYYLLRNLDPATLTPIQQAARFIFLNRFCFNGLYRTNARGAFNVPYGGGRTGDLPRLGQLRAVSAVLQRAELLCKSFETLLPTARGGDFVYLDPPYSISNRRVFKQYSPSVFGVSSLMRLRQELERLESIKAKFLVTYGLSAEGLALSRGFRVRHTTVQRQISGFSTHRRKARELLITNY